MIEVESPVKILMNKKSNKWFALNLNAYRNLHWSQLNRSKKLYADIMFQIMVKDDYHLLKMEKVIITYQIVSCNNRKFDTMNVISIVDKYFQDVLVNLGIIKDDNFKIVHSVNVLPVIINNGFSESLCKIKVEEYK